MPTHADVRVHALAPVIGLDVDGTIADYYEHFRWFCELYLQRPVPKPDWALVDEFNEVLGIDKGTYRDVKLAYRQGGMKRSIPPLDSMVRAMVQELRQLGVQVWICTTRPWQRLDNIDPDTRFWLDRNVGRVDGLIYGEEKYEDLIDHAGMHRILGVIDDLPENIVYAQRLGLRAAIRAGAHNAQWRELHTTEHGVNIPVAYSSVDIYNIVKQWKAL